jgi:predicted nucleic acid-binding protein
MIRFSFDTNVLIYAADAKTGIKHDLARNVIRRAARAKRGALTDQSLVELLHAARKKLMISFRDAIEYVNELAGLFDIVLAEGDTIARAIEIVRRYDLSVWDARMIALCDTHDCSVLLSEDMQDHGRYGRVRVINPFLTANHHLIDEVLST